MKRIREHWKRIVATFLIVTMFATSVSLESFATENVNEEQTETTQMEETSEAT